MSKTFCIAMKELEDIACDVASDIAVHVYKQAEDMGESEEDAMSAAEGAIAMLSDFTSGIKKRAESISRQDVPSETNQGSPRGFICSEELLPKRATSGSAGYDFVAPVDIKIPFASVVKVSTNTKVYMSSDEVLKIYPRSSMAIKRGVTLVNDVAIIDSDFKDTIVLALHNNSMGAVTIKKGEKIAQGIFQKYLTCGDEPSVVRNGGIGSTGK
jgi:dUTP pyrophosphatase|nr:MAG TPA: dUTPase [Caudoviricetes sp.]